MIPSLFVVDNVQGSRFVLIHTEVALGVGVAMTMLFGHEVGRSAARLA